jgi:hypothetical protein
VAARIAVEPPINVIKMGIATPPALRSSNIGEHLTIKNTPAVHICCSFSLAALSACPSPTKEEWALQTGRSAGQPPSKKGRDMLLCVAALS